MAGRTCWNCKTWVDYSAVDPKPTCPECQASFSPTTAPVVRRVEDEWLEEDLYPA